MNQYVTRYSNILSEMVKCAEEEDYKRLNELKQEADKEYTLFIENKDNEIKKYFDSANFGVLKAIFENAAPELFKTRDGRKAMGEYMKTIKEDKNLTAQYALYHSLTNCSDVNDMKEFVKEALDLCGNINKRELVKSNNKLVDIIKKYNINESIDITDKIELFEAIEYVISNKKKLTNLSEINKKVDKISSFLNESITKPNVDIVKEFNEKHGTSLNENSRELVQDIIAANASNRTSKKENIFNKCKNECIEAINNVLSEDESNLELKEKLLEYKDKILNKEFNEDSLVEDIAALLQFKDIILTK